MRSKITIMNQALSLAGQAGEEVTEGSTGPEFALMNRWYPEVVGEAFESGIYNFGRDRITLTTSSTGDFGFDRRWRLPDDILHVLRAFVSDYETQDWEHDGEYLYIDATANVVIEYIRKNSEQRWSATFANGIAKKLASLLSVGINEEFEEGDAHDGMADRALMKAGILSAKQRGPRRAFRRGYLVKSRSYGPRRYRRRGET